MDIPEGWRKLPIGKICNSIVPGRNKPKVFDGTIPWVTTPGIQGRYIPSKSQKNYVSKEEVSSAGGKIVPKGSVVIAAVGDLGLTAITKCAVVLNQQLHAFICPENISNEYIAYFLETQKQYMHSVASKTTIPYMNKTNCESIPIVLPPFSEQKQIANLLGTWDLAIEVTEKLIVASEAQKKAHMQQLLTAKKRLPEFDGEWETTILSRVTQIIMGSSPKSTAYNDKKIGLPLLQGNADIKNRISAPRVYTSQVTKECLVDDILLSVRAPVGEISRSVHDACIGRGISAIRAKENAVQEFVYQWLLFFEPKWARFSQGSTFEAVNSSDIRTLKLRIPLKDEQKKIAAILSDADREIELLTRQLTQLKSEKSALMQQLLTGKRRVKINGEAVDV